MRIRYRTKQMIAVENRYYSRRGAVTFLSALIVALLIFTAVFAVFYQYNANTADSRSFARGAILLAVGYTLLAAGFHIAKNNIGFRYDLVMGFTALSFVAAAALSYILFHTVFCWNFNDKIENPLGFKPFLARAAEKALLAALIILIVYIVVAMIPAKRLFPRLLGRGWVLNILSPLLSVAIVLYITTFAAEESRVADASTLATVFFILMLWLAVRYFFKMLLYAILYQTEYRPTLEQGDPAQLSAARTAGSGTAVGTASVPQPQMKPAAKRPPQQEQEQPPAKQKRPALAGQVRSGSPACAFECVLIEGDPEPSKKAAAKEPKTAPAAAAQPALTSVEVQAKDVVQETPLAPLLAPPVPEPKKELLRQRYEIVELS